MKRTIAYMMMIFVIVTFETWFKVAYSVDKMEYPILLKILCWTIMTCCFIADLIENTGKRID